MKDKRAIAMAFGRAAASYDAVAEVQTHVARGLARKLAALGLRPRAVLDVGAGTGGLAVELARAWPDALLSLVDLAPPMLDVARGKLPDAEFLVADAEDLPMARESFDVVASSMALQWCDDLAGTLRKLAGLLRPGGVLAVTTLLDGTWGSWRAAQIDAGLVPAMQKLPDEAELRRELAFVSRIEVETLLRPYARGRQFLRDVARLGAGVRDGAALAPDDLARAVVRFEAMGAVAEYRVATIWLQRPARAGVFVSGTDTDVGKTVMSAVLTHALGAEYWKPVQTGLSEDAGDSAFLRRMGLRVHPNALELQAFLSPYAAAVLENKRVSLTDFTLPETDLPLVVEGAGGIACPLDETHDMGDLALHLGLPVVLVARTALGTINHTLLAIEHARARGVQLLGVILVGHENSSNRAEIERRGNVQILLECPYFERLDQESIVSMARSVHLRERLGWQF